MFRKATVGVLCAASVSMGLLGFGCEKKKPEVQPNVRVVAPTGKPPAGMAAVPGESGAFISEKPLSVGQYVAYLDGTAQPVPEQWQGLEPAGPAAQRPMTGLSRREAESCATWELKRLPTPDEWQKASGVVGQRPYPWNEDGSPVAAEAEMFLVQDWRSGSDQEMQARQAKAVLPGAILSEHAAQVEALRGQLQGLVEQLRVRQEQQWTQMKPAFFALLEKEKKAAELRALRDGRAEQAAALELLAAEKGRLAAAYKADQMAADQAAQQYTEKLAEVRDTVPQVRKALQDSTAALQEQVVEATKALDQVGSAAAPGALAEAEAALKAPAGPVETMAQALERKAVLQAAVKKLQEQTSPFARIPTADAMAKRTAELDQETRRFTGEDPSAARIAEARRKMGSFGEALGREFLQENLLLQEMDELVDLRARKKAVEAMLAGLQAVLPARPAAQ
jgi:uncharacterized protein YukE